MFKDGSMKHLSKKIKYIQFSILNLFLLFFFLGLISCTEEKELSIDPEIIDMSVSTSAGSITWVDDNDLLQKLEDAISYNYRGAPESQIEKKEMFASDSSQVNVSMNFREEIQRFYIDPDVSNNSVTVELEKEVETGNDDNSDDEDDSENEEENNGSAIELKADGPGSTYELITSVLAPGANPIEVPDCNHTAFGRHIDELFDSELNANVFRFYIHTDPDNDRCKNFDRQRNEIKSYDQSPDNLLGIEGETVVYKWKFKLPAGFQSSSSFTHLHQLKSVGGSLESMPIYTLTTRKSNPDRLELRYAETDNQVTLAQTPLAPLLDVWMEVTETIKYGTSGTYDIVIKQVDNEAVLFEYSNTSIINWRSGASFVRPKWGIYRSLTNDQDLRDESLLYADFSIEEL